MIAGFGIVLWAVSLALAARLAWLGREAGLSPLFRCALWAAVTLAALVLLFRPHEDIFGGEDPGAYINSGITYGRQQKFFEVDPLLAQVPAEVRPDFYYGHAGYGTTKDACLWVWDPERAVVGPHFQPAYPLLIALASRVGDPAWALYVIPVFTLFLALALRALASLLLPWRLAGLATFLLFLLSPLTLWHGRCSRPEIIAGFMFFGGAALLFSAWQGRRWARWPDLLLGAAAVSLAPFFHITAGYLLIPAAVVIALVILRGRDDFLLYPLVALAGLVLFTWQMRHVTDYYGLGGLLNPLIFRPWLAYGLFAAGLAVLAAGCRLGRRRAAAHEKAPDRECCERPRQSVALQQERGTLPGTWRDALRLPRRSPTPGGRVRYSFQHPVLSSSLGWSLGFAAVSTVLILYVAFTRDEAGSLPLLGRPVEHYLYLADFRTFANMVSLPIALLALLGWIAWLIGPAERRRERLVLALVVFPAILLSGNVRDFMMTRYWFLALLPMAALALAALAAGLAGRARSAWTAVLVAGLVILLGFHHRIHLAGVTEFRGLTGFLKPYAEVIKRGNGILLCEYSRLAAPLEHVFGIPTLGLDNERRRDYSRAEKAWEAIMRKYPDHPAFFATPFHAPASDRFDFQLVRDAGYRGAKLVQARQGLPTRVAEHALRLRLYRMSLKAPGRAGGFAASPETYRLDGGNMGLRHFANTRTERAEFDALGSSPTQALIAAAAPGGGRALLTVALTNAPFLELAGLEFAADDAPIAAAAPGVLGFAARWARAKAEIFVPDNFPGGFLILMGVTPRLENGRPMTLVVSADPDRLAALDPEPGRWQWHLVPLPASAAGRWLTLAAEPAWNPGRPGFPTDLGILAGHISFWPAVPGP